MGRLFFANKAGHGSRLMGECAMAEGEKTVADELHEIQLAKARIELRLKERELQQKPKWWVQALGSPAFLAAVVTLLITSAVTWITHDQADKQREAEAARADQQSTVERLRLQRESDKSILLSVVGPNNPYLIASKLKVFLDAGLINDHEHFSDAVQKLEDQPRQQILQNILRASHELPLDFGTEVNLEQLLRSIDLLTLNYFIRLGNPSELLFWLFVDSVEITGEVGAAELMVSPETWDRWVGDGILPQPAPGFPASTPRWNWADVDRKLKGEPEALVVDPFIAGAGQMKDGARQNRKYRTP
jgi:hypothetical protein